MGTKVSDFTEETTPVDGDLLYLVKTPGGTGTSRKVQIANLTKALLEGGVVINDLGAAVNYRVEGDTDPDLISTNGSLDKVGFGLQPSASSSKVQIKASDNNKPVLGLTGASPYQGSYYLVITNTDGVELFWIDSVGAIVLPNGGLIKAKNTVGTPAAVLHLDSGNTLAVRNPFDGQAVYGVLSAGTGHCYFQTQGQNRVDIDPDGLVHLSRGTIAGKLRFLEPSGSGSSGISFTAPALDSDIDFTFPAAVPSVGQSFSVTNVSGNDVTLGYGPTILSATAVLDFPSTAAGAVADLTVSVPGAAVGDVVAISTPTAAVTATSVYTAWVSAPDTVTIRFAHTHLSNAENPGSGTFRVLVSKF